MHVSLQQTLTHSPLALPVDWSFADETVVLVQKRTETHGAFCAECDMTMIGTNVTAE